MEAFLKPMLCGKADLVPEGDEWVAEPKFDGWRAVTHVGDQVRMFCGREGSEYSGKLPYIERVLRTILPPDSVVDGELLGSEWGDVQGVMTRGNGQPHVPSSAVPALTYVLFDITRLNGEDLHARSPGTSAAPARRAANRDRGRLDAHRVARAPVAGRRVHARDAHGDARTRHGGPRLQAPRRALRQLALEPVDQGQAAGHRGRRADRVLRRRRPARSTTATPSAACASGSRMRLRGSRRRA
jgi:hypothetical protein